MDLHAPAFGGKLVSEKHLAIQCSDDERDRNRHSKSGTSSEGFSVYRNEVGVSFYSNIRGLWRDQVKKFKETVSALNHEYCLKVFVAEYVYPSSPMTVGEFKGWNKEAKGYDQIESEQSRLLQKQIAWGKRFFGHSPIYA